jgi:hypothetical protein
MKCLSCVFVALCLSHTAVAAAQPGLILARDGRSDYVIVVPKQPTAVETTAARELADHLQKVTGVKLEIIGEDRLATDRKAILIGATERTKRSLPDADLTKLGADEIVMKTVGQDLLLAGHPKRGPLYAVYTFLEDVVGCRWWTADESFVPKRPTLEIGPLDIVHAPKLAIREAFYRNAFDGVFSARCKCDGHHNRVPAEYGGHEQIVGFVHTFYRLLPPDKYFKDHPEWYSLINGKRTFDQGQLCLTNDAMRRELTKNALALLRATPDAGAISISQNDWVGNCQCEKCKAIEEKEGSPSGPVLRFVNAVAADIEKDFPDVLVETLAYWYTREPPRLAKPRKNVVVRLCSIECSFAQPLADGPQNEKFRQDIERWSKIAPRLYVWDYVTDFSNYLQPHPNMPVLAPNIRFFVEHNVIALFEQGDYGCSVGDFVRLRAWLLAHLMWNPAQDENRLIAEFLSGYYGAAGPHLQAYLDTINAAAKRSGVYLRCFMPDTTSWLGLDELNAATRHFEKAMAAVADDPVLARRVRRERLPLDNVWLIRYAALKELAAKEGKEFLGPADPVAACDEFVKLAQEHDAGQSAEGRPFASYEETLRRLYPAPTKPPAKK